MATGKRPHRKGFGRFCVLSRKFARGLRVKFTNYGDAPLAKLIVRDDYNRCEY